MASSRFVMSWGNHPTIPSSAICIPLTVGKDDTGYDVKMFGDTSGSYLLWDASEDEFLLINSGFSIGSATDTAETKITLEFDEATSGIGLIKMGTTAVPMVLNEDPGSAVIGHTVNILHSEGAGDCDDLYGGYSKVAISGDGDAGTTLVGHAPRAYIGTAADSDTVASACYGSQPWASHYGTGAVTAISGLSAKLDVNTGNFNATTANAGHFHIEGAATVTGKFDGVMIEVYPDVTSMDSVLRLDIDAGATVATGVSMSGTATTGIDLIGSYSKGVDFSSGTWTQGIANFCMAYGTAAAAVSVAATDTIIPFQCNVSVASDDGDTVGTSYSKVSTGGAMTGQIANVMVRTTISHSLLDAYGVQSHLTFGDSVDISTTADNAHLAAVSAKVTFDTSTVTKGWVNAGLFIVEGAGTCSQICHGVSIVEESASTGTQSLLHLYTDVGTTPAFSVSSADGSGKTVYTHAPSTLEGSIRVLINGTAKFVPFYTTE